MEENYFYLCDFIHNVSDICQKISFASEILYTLLVLFVRKLVLFKRLDTYSNCSKCIIIKHLCPGSQVMMRLLNVFPHI